MANMVIHGKGDEEGFQVNIEFSDYQALSYLIGALQVGATLIIPKGQIHLDGDVEIKIVDSQKTL